MTIQQQYLRLARFLILGMVCLVGLVACEDDPVGSPTDILNPTIASFPLTVGSAWTYRRTDSTAATVTTVTVTIDSTLPGSTGSSVTQWLLADGEIVDTLMVTVTGDTLTLDGLPRRFTACLGRYVFPFIVGDGWRGLSPSDSVQVLAAQRLRTPVGTFDRAFEIERELVIPNQIAVWTHWFVPEIGIVQLTFREQFFGDSHSETWELTGYRIP